MNKKGVYFSIDAVIALIIILLSISVIYPIVKYSSTNEKIGGDLINVLSSIKVGEINNSYVKNLSDEGKINNPNKTVLEQIGEFYVSNRSIAREMSQSILEDLDTKRNIGIWYDNNLLAFKNETSYSSAENIDSTKYIISGIKNGSSVTGFSARAYLSNSLQTKYFYFGGYVGEGNISALIDYSGNISSAEMELAINNDFSVYVNDVFVGDYKKSDSDFKPKQYSLDVSNFTSGENVIEIKGNNLHISGGFIKIIYESGVRYSQNERKYFPGIEGVVNLYDGVYVPENLNEMRIHLHLDVNKTCFLSIGNVTVYNDSTGGFDDTINISNSELSSLLDYNELSERTVPIRFGLENATYTSNETIVADTISVTDLSGSMRDECDGGGWCCWWSDCSTPSGCSDCGGTYSPKLSAAKDANDAFIDAVLNRSENRAGLVGYRSSVSDSDCHSLSIDDVSLKSKVDDWYASGGTCICCGINEAVNRLVSESSDDKYNSIIVMSDGEATYDCGGSPTQDAIDAACDAYENHGITVHAVGFGDSTSVDEDTLQQIADCGNGSYYYSTIDEITEIYQQIANEILEASYSEQTINVSGEFYSRLYPDSYIEFEYTKEEIPYGLVTTSEKEFTNETQGNFSLPENSSVLEVRVTSYSGPRWTNNVEINGVSIYSLSDYNSNYTDLGDPYSVNIPNEFVNDTNTIKLTTGVSNDNSTGGSQNNTIIYKTVRNLSSYSSILGFDNGCEWEIEFEDSSTETIEIPSGASENCYYNSTHNTLQESVSNQQDALQNAVFELLGLLDFDEDGKLDFEFSEQNLEISSSQITGIPYDYWTEVEVRRWD